MQRKTTTTTVAALLRRPPITTTVAPVVRFCTLATSHRPVASGGPATSTQSPSRTVPESDRPRSWTSSGCGLPGSSSRNASTVSPYVALLPVCCVS